MKKYLLLLACIGTIASAEVKTDWKAQWINTERCQSASNTWLAYRKTVSIDEVPGNPDRPYCSRQQILVVDKRAAGRL